MILLLLVQLLIFYLIKKFKTYKKCEYIGKTTKSAYNKWEYIPFAQQKNVVVVVVGLVVVIVLVVVVLVVVVLLNLSSSSWMS